jgi:hypothetical protein
MPAFSFSSQTPMACGFAQLVRVKDSGPFPLRSTPSVDVVDDPYGIARRTVLRSTTACDTSGPGSAPGFSTAS